MSAAMPPVAGLTLDRDTHAYQYRGVPVPGVTRVLEVLSMYQGIPADVLKWAAERGDAVHYAAELYDRDELDPSSVPDEVAGYLHAWIRFREESGFVPFGIEHAVYSPTYRYAGTLDRAGEFERGPKLRRVVVDIKATAVLMPSVGPQTALYARALYEQVGGPWRDARRFAVLLRDDGTYALTECRDATDLGVGLACLSIYHWRQRHNRG